MQQSGGGWYKIQTMEKFFCVIKNGYVYPPSLFDFNDPTHFRYCHDLLELFCLLSRLTRRDEIRPIVWENIFLNPALLTICRDRPYVEDPSQQVYFDALFMYGKFAQVNTPIFAHQCLQSLKQLKNKVYQENIGDDEMIAFIEHNFEAIKSKLEYFSPTSTESNQDKIQTILDQLDPDEKSKIIQLFWDNSEYLVVSDTNVNTGSRISSIINTEIEGITFYLWDEFKKKNLLDRFRVVFMLSIILIVSVVVCVLGTKFEIMDSESVVSVILFTIQLMLATWVVS